MKFEVNLVINVDPEANFLEAYSNNSEVVGELIRDCLYDIDDMDVLFFEVKNEHE